MARVSETGIKDIFAFIDAGDNSRLQAYLSTRSGAANARNLQDVSALMYALYRRNHDAVKMLRDKLMSLDIWEAAALGDNRQLRPILQQTADVDAFTADGYSALQLASFFGRPDTVVLLLAAGAQPDLLSANAAKTSALHGAATAGHLEVVQRLIEGGADVHLRSGAGFTALDAAIKKGDDDLIAYIAAAAAAPPIASPAPQQKIAIPPAIESVTRPEPIPETEPAPKPIKAALKATVGTKTTATIGAKTTARIGTKLSATIGAPKIEPAPETQPKPKSFSTTLRSSRERTK